MQADGVLTVECSDPLATIDSHNPFSTQRDALEEMHKDNNVLKSPIRNAERRLLIACHWTLELSGTLPLIIKYAFCGDYKSLPPEIGLCRAGFAPRRDVPSINRDAPPCWGIVFRFIASRLEIFARAHLIT